MQSAAAAVESEEDTEGDGASAPPKVVEAWLMGSSGESFAHTSHNEKKAQSLAIPAGDIKGVAAKVFDIITLIFDCQNKLAPRVSSVKARTDLGRYRDRKKMPVLTGMRTIEIAN